MIIWILKKYKGYMMGKSSQTTIISLLGLSVYDTKSKYENNTKFSIENGMFINSIDVLLHSFPNEKFIFFGTDISIEKHQDKFKEFIKNKDIEFIEYNDKDLKDIFHKITSTIIKNINNTILFDITHSFRDAVAMSIISTIVSQIVYRPNIYMFYAKQEGDKEKYYRYELVSEDILNNSNIAFILSSFISTLRLPPLNSKYQLYTLLNDFSIHLLSNQFKEIYKQDIDKIKKFISNNKKQLFFVDNLLQKLQKLIEEIEKTKNQNTLDKFLYFTDLFMDKDYYLHSSTYLIEAITYYIGEIFKDKNYINFDVEEYKDQQKIVGLLKLEYNTKDFNFPNEYFIDINIDIINKLNRLRDGVASVRHNLVHINIDKTYQNIKEQLQQYIQEFNNIIESKELYNLDESDNNKHITIKSKIKKIFDRYKEQQISNLQQCDIDKIKAYLDKHRDELEKLFQAQKDRKLIIQIKPTQTKIESKKTQKTKIIPKGIDAPKEKIDNFKNIFNNR